MLLVRDVYHCKPGKVRGVSGRMSSIPTRLLRAGMWVALAAVSLACSDSGGPDPVDAGRFRASLRGGATGSFAGIASHRQIDSWSFFSILLQHVPAGGPTEALQPQIVLEHLGEQPGVGTYEVVTGTSTEPPTPASGQMALILFVPHDDGIAQLHFDPQEVTGTVTIDVATDLEYAGRIAVTGPATWSDGSPAGSVQLSAEFRSEPFDWTGPAARRTVAARRTAPSGAGITR